jgi:flagellum-specific peptidoglycan hydrolase FlgJ
MAVKTKTEMQNMTNDQLVAYLNGLSVLDYSTKIDADTKVRYFIYLYGDGIARGLKGTGLFFSAITALKIFESGYGRLIPPNSFNFGGVKYNPKIHEDFVLADTSEIVNGKRIFIKDKFAKFKDAEDGIKKNIAILLGNRYKKARLDARSPEEQIKMIVKSGYSTMSPNEYLKRMQGIIDRVRKKTGFGRIE